MLFTIHFYSLAFSITCFTASLIAVSPLTIEAISPNIGFLAASDNPSCTALEIAVTPAVNVRASFDNAERSDAASGAFFNAVAPVPANLATISSVVMYSTKSTAALRFSGSSQAFFVI